MLEHQEYEELLSNPHLMPSTASAEEIDRFCYGQCHLFAVALSRLTGWSMHIVLDEGMPYWASDENEDDYIASVVHVLCLDDQDRFWDVRGVRPRDSLFREMTSWAIIDQYGSDTHCTEDDLKTYVGYWGEEGGEIIDRPLEQYDEADIAEVTEIVRRVLSDVPGFVEKAPTPAM